MAPIGWKKVGLGAQNTKPRTHPLMTLAKKIFAIVFRFLLAANQDRRQIGLARGGEAAAVDG